MKSETVSDSIDHVSEEAIRKSATNLVRQGSVLMVVRSGILARTVPLAIAGRDLTINQDMKALSPKAGLSSRFLYFFLVGKMPELLGMVSKGATVHRLDMEHFKKLRVPVPPLAEQERITAILDQAFAGIAVASAGAESAIRKVRHLKDAAMRCLLGRDKVTNLVNLGEVCCISSNLIDPRDRAYAGLLHIGAGNMDSRTGGIHSVQTAEKEGLISSKFLFDQTVVLYSKIRPYLKKVVRPDFQGLCSADVYPLEPVKSRMTRNFLYHLLLSNEFSQYAIQGSARSGMPKVNRNHLFRFRFNLPALNRQAEITTELDCLEREAGRLESVYQQKFTALNALKQSLLHQAFSGNL